MEKKNIVDSLVGIIQETEEQDKMLQSQNVGWRKELRERFDWTQNTTIKGKVELEKFIQQELDKAREEGRMSAMNELKRAFSKVFYKSGELWFDYLFEDGDTEAEEDAKAVVEGYWEDILSELKDNK